MMLVAERLAAPIAKLLERLAHEPILEIQAGRDGPLNLVESVAFGSGVVKLTYSTRIAN